MIVLTFCQVPEHSDHEVISGELNVGIQMAVESLPQKTSVIFKMSRHGELTYKEIASELNVSVKMSSIIWGML